MRIKDKLLQAGSAAWSAIRASRKARVISASALGLTFIAFGAAGVAPLPDAADLPVTMLVEELAVPDLATQIASLSSPGVEALSSDEVQGWNATQLSAITSRQLSALSTAALADFSETQLGSFTSTQLRGLTASQLNTLGANPAAEAVAAAKTAEAAK